MPNKLVRQPIFLVAWKGSLFRSYAVWQEGSEAIALVSIFSEIGSTLRVLTILPDVMTKGSIIWKKGM